MATIGRTFGMIGMILIIAGPALVSGGAPVAAGVVAAPQGVAHG